MANRAPPIADGAMRVLVVARGSQATCMQHLGAFGATQPTPPTGASDLPFAPLDGGGCKYSVRHGGPLSVVAGGGDIPITFAKAVHSPTFTFDIISVGVIEEPGVATILGANQYLVKGSTVVKLHKSS